MVPCLLAFIPLFSTILIRKDMIKKKEREKEKIGGKMNKGCK